MFVLLQVRTSQSFLRPDVRRRDIPPTRLGRDEDLIRGNSEAQDRKTRDGSASGRVEARVVPPGKKDTSRSSRRRPNSEGVEGKSGEESARPSVPLRPGSEP